MDIKRAMIKRKGLSRLYRAALLVAINLSLLTLSSCVGDRCNSPFGEGGTLDVTMPDFSPLSNVGGSMMINRGYRGIMLTRTSYSDFVAFEATCPGGCDVRLEADPSWGNTVLNCPVCSSRFNALDGSALNGSSTPCPLYQYNTAFDGRLLSIFP